MAMEDVRTPCVSEYELSREERIRENRERMRKLGIIDLSVKFKSIKPSLNTASRRKIARGVDCSPLSQPGPIRRSSRLQNSTPVSYCESVSKKCISINDDLLRENGSKPEVYTEEHEKLLGSTERSWELFVDGCGQDGKRIYDPVKGKTCHQCRQKTLGHRTKCSKCNMVQGQFCGDCLYMRYGEHVLEANENPNWICPVCRGICNCSLCRQAKGWPPTGTLYRKISSLGYKSVAHYLIQTRLGNADSDGPKVPMSSRRSLPFPDTDTTMGEGELSKASAVSVNIDPPSEVDKESKIASDSNAEPVLESANAPRSKDKVGYPINPEAKQHGHPEYGMEKEFKDLSPGGLGESQVEPNMSAEPQVDQMFPASSNCHGNLFISGTLERGKINEVKKEENMNMDSVDVGVPETSPKATKKLELSQSTPDSIAQRLRERRMLTRNMGEELKLGNAKNATKKANDTCEIADGDSIASRLKRRQRA